MLMAWPGKEDDMAKQLEGVMAPDFTLADLAGNPVTLSSYRGDRHVVLVFNRGFM
jgi:peroxiredoxin